MSTRSFILGRIDRFLAENGMSANAFGTQAVGDHRFLIKLRHASVTLRLIERAERFMDAVWHKNAGDACGKNHMCEQKPAGDLTA